MHLLLFIMNHVFLFILRWNVMIFYQSTSFAYWDIGLFYALTQICKLLTIKISRLSYSYIFQCFFFLLIKNGFLIQFSELWKFTFVLQSFMEIYKNATCILYLIIYHDFVLMFFFCRCTAGWDQCRRMMNCVSKSSIPTQYNSNLLRFVHESLVFCICFCIYTFMHKWLIANLK